MRDEWCGRFEFEHCFGISEPRRGLFIASSINLGQEHEDPITIAQSQKTVKNRDWSKTIAQEESLVWSSCLRNGLCALSFGVCVSYRFKYLLGCGLSVLTSTVQVFIAKSTGPSIWDCHRLASCQSTPYIDFRFQSSNILHYSTVFLEQAMLGHGRSVFLVFLRLMLMPNAAFCTGLQTLAKFEAARVGVQWDNVFMEVFRLNRSCCLRTWFEWPKRPRVFKGFHCDEQHV